MRLKFIIELTKQIEEGREKVRMKDTKRSSPEKLVLLLMALIPVSILIVFAYAPLWGWVYAFFDYRIGMPLKNCEFVGLKYFFIALKDPNLYRVLVNTLAMSFLSLLIIPLSAAFAILLSELRFKKYGKLVQTVTTLPNFMSWIIVFSICFVFFSPGGGVVNTVLMKAGILKTPITPLQNVNITWIFQTLIKYWKELGYNSIIFFASIAGIDAELYDAAKVDGAGRWALIRHVTIPGLAPTILVLLLINVGFILSNGFDQYYVFHNGMVAPKLEVLDYYVYKMGMANKDIPYATAVSVAKTFVSVVLVYSTNTMSKKLSGKSVL